MHSRVLLLLLLAAATPLAGCGGGETVQALYCYKTLADVDCYSEPVAQDRRRLVGYVGAPPPAPEPARPLAPPPPRPELAEAWDADQISR